MSSASFTNNTSSSTSDIISSLNDGLKVLSPRSEDALKSLKVISNSLRIARSASSNNSAPTAQAPSREDIKKGAACTQRYNFACDDVCIDTLRMIGEEIASLVSGLEASIEDHFVGFFGHVRQKHEKELSLWVRGSGMATMSNNNNNQVSSSTSSSSARFNNNNTSSSSTSGLVKDLSNAMQFVSSNKTEQNNSITTTGNDQNKASFVDAMIENPNTVKPVLAVADNVQRDLSMFALQSWLMIELESLVSQMAVTRAAVYLKGLDNSDFLKLAAAVPKAQTYYNSESSNQNTNQIPKQISSASHSILTTVVSTGVGASITKQNNAIPNPRGEIPFNKLMCLPLYAGKSTDAGPGGAGVLGCVVVTDKASGLDFDTVDELRLWGFAQSACGVLQRYSTEWFVPPLTVSGAKHNHAPPEKRPRVGTVDHLQDQILTTLDSAASLPRIDDFKTTTTANATSTAIKNTSTDSSVGFGRRKQFVSTVNTNTNKNYTNNTSTSHHHSNNTTNTGHHHHQKIPFVRTGTVELAAKNKQRISQIAGSSNFMQHKNLLLLDESCSPAGGENKNNKNNNNKQHQLIATELSHEEVIESVAPYLRNLEGLWRKALDECARMKNECTNWRTRVDEKDAKIIELEVALRHLNRTVGALQSDVELIRNAVPEGLALANMGRDAEEEKEDEEQKELERQEFMRKTLSEMY